MGRSTDSSSSILMDATHKVLEKLCFDKTVGNLNGAILPEEYLRRFRDATEETKEYTTEQEEQLESITKSVTDATDEIEQILERAEGTISVASEDLKVIDTAQKSLQALEELQHLGKDGSRTAFDTIQAAISSLSSRLLASQEEVIAGKNRVHELETEISTDFLTKAKNRVALDKKLIELEEKQKEFSVIQCDLDFFKVINDTFGHAAGDEVLQVFTKRLQKSLKASDGVYRCGGDEFVVLLEGTADPLHVKKIISRLKAAVYDSPVRLCGKEVPISSSMGGGVCDWSTSSAKAEAFHFADKMLYKDKESEMRQQIRIEMEKVSIEHAGQAKGFRV